VRTKPICGVLAACALFGQPSTFEVATIKPSSPDAQGSSMTAGAGGVVTVTNATLKMLLTTAYDVRDFQISGGPGWITSGRFDIVGRPERTAGAAALPASPKSMTDDQLQTAVRLMRERLQSLLADRFQLQVHRETRDAPIYALLVAKNGPKMQTAPEGRTGQRGINVERGRLTAMSAPLAILVNWLSNQTGRPVIDKTGLAQKFDFKLEWQPDLSDADQTGPSIFTAIQEQLGLRLESQRGPVDIIVIDRAEKPSEN